VILLLVLVSVAMGAAGQLLLKVGALTPVRTAGDLAINLIRPATLAGLMLYVVSSLLWMTVLSRSQLSYAYPLLSLNYVLVILISASILHEPVSVHRWLGILVIMAGFLLSATS
jgi:drug/metabolite transporter (DMT)-like permease